MTIVHPRITAEFDPSLHVVVDDLLPLVYSDPPEPDRDLPLHARAASAVRRFGRHTVIVQDDVNALAVYDRVNAKLSATILPRGPDGRRQFADVIGNKHHKMDLESLTHLRDGRLVAFGSGASTARESLVVVSRRAPPLVRDGSALYRSLRAETAFAGSELNIEGALSTADRLVLFQRGNGRAAGSRTPSNALGTMDLESFVRWLDDRGPLPMLLDVTPCDLGTVDELPLGFTDAAAMPDGRLAILACAEDSPDALHDGAVLGCRFGWLEPDGRLRMADVLEGGRPTRLKLEGIEPIPGSSSDFDVVADGDDVDRPALLGRLHVRE